jgi:hypothetical protein
LLDNRLPRNPESRLSPLLLPVNRLLVSRPRPQRPVSRLWVNRLPSSRERRPL